MRHATHPPDGAAGAAPADAAPTEAVQVRLAASPHTDAGTLLRLAADGTATVRAAVAMNRAAPAPADRLLAGDADERVREVLAGKLAALLPALSEAERARAGQQALQTLCELVRDQAVRVRAAIADAVKEMPHAPRDLILALAHDAALPVCDPVIRLSPLLAEADLLALLACRPAAGVAASVAARAGLGEAVADAVAASADSAAIRALLANPSAAIREATLDALVGRAGGQPDWHAPMVHRPVLPPRAARALAGMVATDLLATLAARADLDPQTAIELRARLAARLQGETPSPPTPAQALERAYRLQGAGRLDEAALLDAAARGDAGQLAVLLAVAAGVPRSVVERAALLRSAKGLVSLVWKAGFTMQAAAAVQALLARLPPEAMIGPAPDGGYLLCVEEMRWQAEFLCRVGR